MRSILAFLALLSITFISSPVFSEELLSLDHAVELALQRNPLILAAEKEALASKGRLLQTQAMADPQIFFNEGGLPLKRNRDEGSEYEFGIEQSFEFPGKRKLRVGIGRYDEELAGLETERIRSLVTAHVKRSYYKTVLCVKTIQSLESSSSILNGILDNITEKFRTGAASYGDVLRARADMARIRNQIIEEIKQERSARNELNLLLGRKSSYPAVLTTDLVYMPFEKDHDSLVAEMKRTRPSFKISDLIRNRSEKELALARKSRLPDFSLGLSFPSKSFNAWGFSLAITVPIWGTKQTGEILEAEAVRDSIEISTIFQEQKLLSSIEIAYAEVLAAEDQVKVFEKHLLKDMEEEIRNGLNLYRHDKIEFFNLLDLFRSFKETRIEYLKSLCNYLTAMADLEISGEEENE